MSTNVIENFYILLLIECKEFNFRNRSWSIKINIIPLIIKVCISIYIFGLWFGSNWVKPLLSLLSIFFLLYFSKPIASISQSGCRYNVVVAFIINITLFCAHNERQLAFFLFQPIKSVGTIQAIGFVCEQNKMQSTTWQQSTISNGKLTSSNSYSRSSNINSNKYTK